MIVFQSPRRWGGGEEAIMFALPKAAWYEFQSPQRWGGGLGRSDNTSTALPGGIVSIPSEVGRGRALHVSAVDDTKVHRSVSFQSPRRWGGVGLVHLASPAQRLRLLSFNPLGGGAGSGSRHMQKAMEQISASGFQSPRRWGGVGLVHLASPAQRLRLLSFNPLGGGAGSGSEDLWARQRGRCYEFRFNPLGGGAGSGSAVAATTGPT